MNFEGQRTNLQYYGNKDLKSFYRQELDTQLAHKQHMKQLQLKHKQEQRLLFIQRMAQQDELQRIKDISYKNYYQMVMNNQTINANNLKEKRDSRVDLKERLITQSTYQDGQRLITDDSDREKKLLETKNVYRRDLLEQLRANEMKKEQEKYRKLEERVEGEKRMGEIKDYEEKERSYHKEVKLRYKDELDRLKEDGKAFEGYRKEHEKLREKTREKTEETMAESEVHNVISNPLPYRIQNPYILKELRRNNGNKGYFAGIAAMGFEN